MKIDKELVRTASYIIAGCLFLYFAIAIISFQFRNPKANEAACLIHVVDALQFKSLPQFQE